MPRNLLILTAVSLLLALGGLALAQDDPAILEFRTYELGWARYRNVDSAGNPKLAADAGTSFPFIRVNNGYGRIRMDDLEDPDATADLIAFHDIAYDEAAIAGACDPNKLAPGSSDIFCVPGTSGMEHGQIFLALFDPETGALLAITTTIDNKAGGAQRQSWAPTPEPAPAATPEPEPAKGCGPYAPGQWIDAGDLDASLGLTIVGDGDHVTAYVCMMPADGGAYLQGHPLLNGEGGGDSRSASTSGGGSSGGGQSGGASSSGARAGGAAQSGGGERSDTGEYTEGIISEPLAEECLSRFGCDGGPGEE